MRIHLLDPLIANQIAAGEVIERPASIVKELLENSLDAGATELTIDIEKGGLQLIRIKDNGFGIHKEDLPLAVQRHGTSKISTLQDLIAIQSLGFRGEALASICAVSRFKISSCAEGQKNAWQLLATGTDTELLEKPVAHLRGTTIEVRDLFFNTPVRRKFLRTEKTEFFHIEEVVKRVALAKFDLRLELNHNGRSVFKLLPATTELQQQKRIKQLCVKGFIEHALKIDVEATGLRVWGWIATLPFIRSQNDLQYLYINGRMVRDKLINHGVRQAYQQMSSGKFAAYILFLECDPTSVDVNVHPTKHEVRFRESRLIHDFIYSSLRNALAQAEGAESSLEHNPAVTQITNYNKTPNLLRYKIAETMANYTVLASTHLDDQENPSIIPKLSKKYRKILTCLQGKFLVLEQETELMILDICQLRTKLLKYLLTDNPALEIQPLLFPLNITLNKQQMLSLEKYNNNLLQFGIDISIIGINQVMLRTAPKKFQDIDLASLLPELLNRLSAVKEGMNLEDIIAKTAALFFNRNHKQEVYEQLLIDAVALSESEFNNCCVYFSLEKIEKLFL